MARFFRLNVGQPMDFGAKLPFNELYTALQAKHQFQQNSIDWRMKKEDEASALPTSFERDKIFKNEWEAGVHAMSEKYANKDATQPGVMQEIQSDLRAKFRDPMVKQIITHNAMRAAEQAEIDEWTKKHGQPPKPWQVHQRTKATQAYEEGLTDKYQGAKLEGHFNAMEKANDILSKGFNSDGYGGPVFMRNGFLYNSNNELIDRKEAKKIITEIFNQPEFAQQLGTEARYYADITGKDLKETYEGIKQGYVEPLTDKYAYHKQSASGLQANAYNIKKMETAQPLLKTPGLVKGAGLDINTPGGVIDRMRDTEVNLRNLQTKTSEMVALELLGDVNEASYVSEWLQNTINGKMSLDNYLSQFPENQRLGARQAYEQYAKQVESQLGDVEALKRLDARVKAKLGYEPTPEEKRQAEEFLGTKAIEKNSVMYNLSGGASTSINRWLIGAIAGNNPSLPKWYKDYAKIYQELSKDMMEEVDFYTFTDSNLEKAAIKQYQDHVQGIDNILVLNDMSGNPISPKDLIGYEPKGVSWFQAPNGEYSYKYTLKSPSGKEIEAAGTTPAQEGMFDYIISDQELSIQEINKQISNITQNVGDKLDRLKSVELPGEFIIREVDKYENYDPSVHYILQDGTGGKVLFTNKDDAIKTYNNAIQRAAAEARKK